MWWLSLIDSAVFRLWLTRFTAILVMRINRPFDPCALAMWVVFALASTSLALFIRLLSLVQNGDRPMTTRIRRFLWVSLTLVVFLIRVRTVFLVALALQFRNLAVLRWLVSLN